MVSFIVEFPAVYEYQSFAGITFDKGLVNHIKTLFDNVFIK